MTTNGRPSMAKRQREIAKQEKQRDKAAKRAQRALDKKNGVVTPDDAPEEIAAAEAAGGELAAAPAP